MARSPKLFSPVAYTISYALFGALLCSLFLVPSLAYIAFHKPSKVFHNVVLERLQTLVEDGLLS